MVLVLTTVLAAAAAIDSRHRCGACLALEQSSSCSDGASSDLCSDAGLLRAAQSGCIASGACERPQEEDAAGASETVQLRVAKGLGTRHYNTLRVSVITAAKDKPPVAFDYSSPFAHRWKQFAVHSSILSVVPGTPTPLNLGGGSNATLLLPKQGDGVAGVLIADPCVRFASVTSLVECNYAEKFKTRERTPKLLNAFIRHADTAFWGVLGDNWYDRDGTTTKKIYAQLELSVLAKPMITVAGNHDYWILASPKTAMRDFDQFGNGHLQFYAQDTLAARGALPGTPTAPFNLSVDPSRGAKSFFGSGNLPAVDNSVFYHQMGNLGLVGFSGAYELDEVLPRMAEACAWLPKQTGLKVAILVGHWDKPNDGASNDSYVPGMYEHVRTLPGCRELDQARRLKFIMGHTHCNVAHPHGHNETGFMVAGQGMSDTGYPGGGCRNYGIPVVDSTGGRLRMWYFPVADLDRPAPPPPEDEGGAHAEPPDAANEGASSGFDRYDEVHACVDAHGWRACTHLATLWLNQSLS